MTNLNFRSINITFTESISEFGTNNVIVTQKYDDFSKYAELLTYFLCVKPYKIVRYECLLDFPFAHKNFEKLNR